MWQQQSSWVCCNWPVCVLSGQPQCLQQQQQTQMDTSCSTRSRLRPQPTSALCVSVCVLACVCCVLLSPGKVWVCVGKKNSLEEWLRAAAAASFTVSHSLRRDPHTKWLKQRVNWEMHSRWLHIFPWIPASWNLCNYRVESHSDTRRCYKGDLVLQRHFHFFTQHLTCTVRSTLSLTDSNKAKRHNTR